MKELKAVGLDEDRYKRAPLQLWPHRNSVIRYLSRKTQSQRCLSAYFFELTFVIGFMIVSSIHQILFAAARHRAGIKHNNLFTGHNIPPT